jgi:hypothetical protein
MKALRLIQRESLQFVADNKMNILGYLEARQEPDARLKSLEKEKVLFLRELHRLLEISASNIRKINEQQKEIEKLKLQLNRIKNKKGA